MSRKFFSTPMALSVIGLMAALVLGGCVTGAPVSRPTATRASVPPAVETILASQPTPVVVISTTAKELDPSSVATLAASPRFDVPDGKYLLLRVGEIRNLYTECYPLENPPGDSHNGSEPSPTEQGQAMRDMIRQGAKGFVDVSYSEGGRGPDCDIAWMRRDPIKELPSAFFLSPRFDMALYRVDRDGTIAVRIGDAIYLFKPGDTWSYEEASVEFSVKSSYRLSFRNDGLLDESQFPELSAPAPAPGTPTITAAQSSAIFPRSLVGRRG